MTIDGAIKNLSKIALIYQGSSWKDERGALELGVEALKKWKLLREGRAGIIDPLLPGETEEVK